MTAGQRNGFDRLARPYRWMEYLSFGRALERCRFRFLDRLTGTHHALLLGDGDGRFSAKLVATAPNVKIEAVDVSIAMLRALLQRCALSGAAGCVTTHQADLSQGLPPLPAEKTFDLVTTHFFFDCLTTAQVERLVAQVRPTLEPHARWVVSEFAVPRSIMRLPSALVVRGLYLGFRLLTGLRVQQLPAYREVLRENGFELESEKTMLGGLLVSELWRVAS